MRIYFELSPNKEPVPFDYQHFLIGTFHKWLGKNEIHDGISLYSISWLSMGRQTKNGLNFPSGAIWYISVYDIEVAKRILGSALEDPTVCCGMKIVGVRLANPPQLNGDHRFIVTTPVLVKHFDGTNVRHMTYKDENADAILTQVLRKKMKAAGLDPANVSVMFDRSYAKARTRLVTIKGIHNKASLCPVIIKGHSEALAFAWDVGVGHSTGSGFGALL